MKRETNGLGFKSRDAVRHVKGGLMGCALSTLLAGGSAFAQGAAAVTTPESAAPADNAIEEVVVTGTRIRGTAPVGAPVVKITREDIVEAGASNTVQVLQQLPQVLNLGVSDASRGTSGGAGNISYASGIDIHGIGPYATLTLLDGRRIVQSGPSGGLPDPNNIPTIMLQRVEVVADGASAIYGSDAIAGVANLILRTDFDGVEAQARYGTATNYNDRNLGLLVGHTWASGNITASFENSHQSDLSGLDRSFYHGNLTSQGGGNFLAVNCNPGNIVIGGVSHALPALAAGTTNRCDDLKTEDLLPEQARNSFAYTFRQQLGENTKLISEGFISHRTFEFTPGTLNAALSVPDTNAFFESPPGATPARETVDYAFGTNNTSTGYANDYQFTLGLVQTLPHRFELDIDATYGHDVSRSTSWHGLNNGALTKALASGNPATAFNPFGGTNSASVLSGILDSEFSAPGDESQYQGTVTLNGPIVSLPGGDAQLAVGGEYDYDRIYTGTDTGAPPPVSSRTIASRNVKAGFAEIKLPLVTDSNEIPGIHRLELSAAGRYEDYNDVGSTTNPKFAINYSPVDGLLLHGTYGTSFRAPNLTQIHGASNALYVQTYQTPTGPIQGVTLSGLKAGNPLSPETATTHTFGADLKPAFIPGFTATLNYFDIKYTKQVAGILANLTILQNPQTEALYNSLIVRNPPASLVNSFVAQGYPVNGVLPNPVPVFVYGNSQNLGVTIAKGIDFQLNQILGPFALGVNGTYFTSYEVAVTPAAPVLSMLNTIDTPQKFRARAFVRWHLQELEAAAFVNYTGEYKNILAVPTQEVSSYATVDLHVGYDLGGAIRANWSKGLVVALDVTNAFDKDPPFVNIAESPNGGGGFDPTAANPIGRLIGFSVRKTW